MKLSNRSHYALRALFDIAFHGGGQPILVRDIATRQSIPARFLEQIFQDLKRARLVISKRGPRGGYRLARDPESISVGDVVRAAEGPMAMQEDKRSADPAAAAAMRQLYPQLERAIEAVLDEQSLKALCEAAAASGHEQELPLGHNYMI